MADIHVCDNSLFLRFCKKVLSFIYVGAHTVTYLHLGSALKGTQFTVFTVHISKQDIYMKRKRVPGE